jgi:hypothetical protein
VNELCCNGKVYAVPYSNGVWGPPYEADRWFGFRLDCVADAVWEGGGL